jgi:hypothetical protein
VPEDSVPAQRITDPIATRPMQPSTATPLPTPVPMSIGTPVPTPVPTLRPSVTPNEDKDQ